MEEKKRGRFFFRRGTEKKGGSWWPWRKVRSSGFRWRRLQFQLWFVDGVLFKIVSVLEAIVLVAALCFFYLVCGCHF